MSSAENLMADGALTVEAASEFSGIGRSELYAVMDRGELPYAKHGRRRLIPRKALVEFLSRGLVGGPAAQPVS